MGPIDAFWHLAGFFAPALALGAISAWLSKLLWRGALAGVSWWRLARGGSCCAALVLVAGLIVFGSDGRAATYFGTALATALSIWWTGFGRGRR